MPQNLSSSAACKKVVTSEKNPRSTFHRPSSPGPSAPYSLKKLRVRLEITFPWVEPPRRIELHFDKQGGYGIIQETGQTFF